MVDTRRSERASRAPAPRWWRNAHWAVGAAVCVACGVILWADLAPIMDFAPALIATWFLTVLAAVWSGLALFGWLRFRAFRDSAITPSLVVLSAVLVLSSAPSRIGFHYSVGGLESAARTCTLSDEDRRIGVYEVTSVTPLGDNGCRFATQGGLIRSVGVAHLPHGVPPDSVQPDTGGFFYEHLTGDWFTFYRDF